MVAVVFFAREDMICSVFVFSDQVDAETVSIFDNHSVGTIPFGRNK
jgi:hypothetical protein